MAVIRIARSGDADGIGRVQVDSWRSTYPGMIPDPYLVGLSETKASARWRLLLGRPSRYVRTYVADDRAEGVLGFGTCGGQRTSLPGYGGEFYALYLLEHAQGQGLGRRLIATMAGHMLHLGMQSAVVWVLRDNPARWFYERLGGTRVAEQTIDFAGGTLVETAYGWHDLMPLARITADPRVE